MAPSVESVRNMSDDELKEALVQFKDPASLGPINSTTRKIYEKLLLRFLGLEEDDEGVEGDSPVDRHRVAEDEEQHVSDYDDPSLEDFHLRNEEPVFNQFADDLNDLRARRRPGPGPAGDEVDFEESRQSRLRASDVNQRQDSNNNVNDGAMTPVQAVLFAIFVIAVVFYILIGFKTSQ